MAQDIAGVSALIDGEWSAFIDLLGDRRAAWDRPTRLRSWRIEDLARHVHWGITLETEGLVLSASGAPGRATGRQVTGPPEELVPALQSAARGLVDAVRSIPEDHSAPVPMPYGDIPLDLALQIFMMESAMHRSDLAQAVTGDIGLTAGAVPATATVLQTFWAGWAAAAAEPPAAGTGILLEGETVSVGSTFDGREWGPLVGEPSVVLSGRDDTLLLYAYGRVQLDDAGLTVVGDRSIAARLKELVPGP